ncbi:MAG: 16S rRNA (uracil(1498)-N(3))-methyltransferase [Betaproteobacteria bacterium]
MPRPAAAGADLRVEIELNEEIARHLQVLRLAAGEQIALFDGQGGEWAASISAIGKRNATVQLLAFDAVERESPLSIMLVQALATSDKMDFIVQKAVELGVTSIQPLATERATLKLTGEREQKRMAHWQAVAQSACEQCGRNRVPVVAGLMSLEAWLATPANSLRLMLHPDADISLTQAVAPQQALSLVVGPEGGFSPREIALAAQHGVQTARFGSRVLRTETAALAALAALNALHGDLG